MHTQACKTRGGVWGHSPPGIFFLEIRCSEIASEASLGQKGFWLSTYAFTKPADFEQTVDSKVGRTAGEVISLEGKLVNSRAPEIACFLFLFFIIIYFLRMYIRASFHRSGVNSLRARSVLVLHEQARIAATILVWTAVLLNSNESSGPISNGRAL